MSLRPALQPVLAVLVRVGMLRRGPALLAAVGLVEVLVYPCALAKGKRSGNDILPRPPLPKL